MSQEVLDENSQNENEVYVEPHEILSKIEEMTKNEIFSPVILAHNFEPIYLILEQTKRMDEDLKSASMIEVSHSLVKLEIQRINYLISQYCRCRIKKIESQVFYLSQLQESDLDLFNVLLSSDEILYFENYKGIVEEMLKNSISSLPPSLKTLDYKKLNNNIKMDNFVFVRVLETLKGVYLTQEFNSFDLVCGSRYFLPFSSIYEALKEGKVVLE